MPKQVSRDFDRLSPALGAARRTAALAGWWITLGGRSCCKRCFRGNRQCASAFLYLHTTTGHNLVIHEFAHQLDMLDGYLEGTLYYRQQVVDLDDVGV